MRKFPALCLAALLLFLSLTACAKPVEAPAAAPTPAPVERTESVTVPEDVLERCDLDIHAAARRMGLPEASKNIDGSYTLYLTGEEKAALAASARETLSNQLDALPESGAWPFLLAAELSPDCRSVTLMTEAALYAPLRDRTAAETVYLPSLLCLALCGEETDGFTQQFTVKDRVTGETLDTFVFPETAAPIPAAGE